MQSQDIGVEKRGVTQNERGAEELRGETWCEGSRMVMDTRDIIQAYLPVMLCGLRRRLGEQGEVPFVLVDTLATVASPSSAESSQCAQTGQADEAVVAHLHQALAVVLGLLSRNACTRLALGWSQDGGHVERSHLTAMIGLG